MAWHHIEDQDEQVREGKLFNAGSKTDPRHEWSTKTLGLSVWRCGSCRAMAVTMKGTQPGGKCGKCK